jgi:hypothetical protein
MSSNPSNPFAGTGQMLAAAVTHHEMVTSYVQAGFTREEAISITSDMLKAARANELWLTNENKRRDEGKL